LFVISCVPSFNSAVSIAEQSLEELQFIVTKQQQQLDKQVKDIENLKLRFKENDDPAISVYGQMSFLAVQVDDGSMTDSYFGTNSINDNRLGVSTLLKQNDSFIVGSRLQLAFNPGATKEIVVRQAEVYLDFTDFGKLTFGQGETASDDVAYVDLSGMKLAGRSSVIGSFASAYHFNSDSNQPRIRIGDVVNELDGLSRKVRIRYDSKDLNGFTMSASATDKDQDIALRTNHDFNNLKLSTALAVTSEQAVGSGSGGEKASGKVVSGSMSVLSGGFVFTAAAGQLLADEPSRESPNYYFFKPTYRFNFFDTGFTGFSASYGHFSSFMQNNDVAVSRGIQTVQHIKSLNLKAYVGYSDVKLKRAGTDFDKINVFLAGLFYKF
jgi:uncharacterized coiled-coil protein SlyX/predicted porin